MTFEEILTQVQELLQREGRVAYRILKRRFALNDDDLEDLKADLIDAKRLAVDEEGKVLVWVGTDSEGERGNGEEAEECFLKAIAIAQTQQAKSLELRAVMSLARLWQQQALEHGAGSKEQGARSQESGVRSQESGAGSRHQTRRRSQAVVGRVQLVH